MKSGLSVPYGSPNLYNPSSVRIPLSSTSSENNLFERPQSTKALCLDRSIISDPENIIGTSPKSQLKINEFSSRLLHLDYRAPADFRPNLSDTFHDNLLNPEQKFSSTHHDTSFNELSKGGQLHSPNIKDSSLRALAMLKINTAKTEKIFAKKSPGKAQNKTTKCLQEIRKLSQPNQANQASYISRINPIDKVDLFNQIVREKEYFNTGQGKVWPDEKKSLFIGPTTPKGYKGISINTDLQPREMGLLPRNLNIQRTTVKKDQGINIFKCEKKDVRESVNSPLKNTGDESPTQCQDSPIRVNIVRALENKTKVNNDIKNFSIFAFAELKKNEEQQVQQASKANELRLIPVPIFEKKEADTIISENLGLEQTEKMGPHTKMLHITPRKPDCAPMGRKRLPESVQLNLERSTLIKGLERKLLDIKCSEYMQDITILKGVLDFLSLTSLCQMTRVCKKFRSEEYARLIRKAQCKVIIQGPKEEDQYGFWDFFVNFEFLQRKYPLQYMMNSMKPSTYERDILSDIDRTYTFNELLDSRQGSLLKVLIAFSNAVPKIGYIQGLNSIAAVFLSHKVTEPEAYWLMKYIFKKKKFDELLTEEFSKVQLLTYQLEIYMRNYVPEIIDHLGENGMNISYFATQWFITMFAYDLELTHLTKIWNMFFIKGWKVLIRVALTILWHFQAEICRQSPDELPSFLKSFVRERIKEIPEDDLFGVALSFKVSNRLLKGLETLYEHSAPINVLLVSSPHNKLEWKIVSEECSSMDVSSAVQKDIMEYLNENIDQARAKAKAFSTKQDHNKHSSEAANISLALDDVSTEYGISNRPFYNPTTKFTDQTFIQTLSNFGQKLKQILTPKDHNQDSFFLGRKVSNGKPFEIIADKETESQTALTDRSVSRSNANSNVKNRKLVVSNDTAGGTPFKKSIITSLKDRNNKLGINLFDPLNFNLQKDRDNNSHLISGHKTTTASIHEAVFHTERKSSMTEVKMTKHKRNSSFNQEATHFLQKSQTLYLGQMIDRRNEELGIISRRNTDQFKNQLKLAKAPIETNQSLYFDHLSRNNSLHNNTLNLHSDYYMNHVDSGRKRTQRGYGTPLNLSKISDRG